MNLRLIAIGLTLAFLIVGLCGCSGISNTINPDKSKFVGKWLSNTGVNGFEYDFFSDGSFLFNGMNETYDIIDNQLALEFDVGMNRCIDYYNYIFSENNTMVTLTSATQTLVLLKQV